MALGDQGRTKQRHCGTQSCRTLQTKLAVPTLPLSPASLGRWTLRAAMSSHADTASDAHLKTFSRLARPRCHARGDGTRFTMNDGFRGKHLFERRWPPPNPLLQELLKAIRTAEPPVSLQMLHSNGRILHDGSCATARGARHRYPVSVGPYILAPPSEAVVKRAIVERMQSICQQSSLTERLEQPLPHPHPTHSKNPHQ